MPPSCVAAADRPMYIGLRFIMSQKGRNADSELVLHHCCGSFDVGQYVRTYHSRPALHLIFHRLAVYSGSFFLVFRWRLLVEFVDYE